MLTAMPRNQGGRPSEDRSHDATSLVDLNIRQAPVFLVGGGLGEGPPRRPRIDDAGTGVGRAARVTKPGAQVVGAAVKGETASPDEN
jgi:hypothetical protein